MDGRYEFPHPADVIAENAGRTLGLPFEERFDRLLALIATGRAIRLDPAVRQASLRYKDRMEAEWQHAHRRVFERYGK
jgi:hypothetical protein